MGRLDPPHQMERHRDDDGEPLLGALVCAFVELFTTNPRLVYQIVYAVFLTTFLIASLYAAHALWDAAAGHVACLFILTRGARATGAGAACWPRVSSWGLAYLARWEALLFVVATGVLLCAMYIGKRDFRALGRGLPALQPSMRRRPG